MAIDFRSLVDEVCRAQPNEEFDGYLILELYLEKRAHARNLVVYHNWEEVHGALLEHLVGRDALSVDLSDDDFEYLVDRLIDRLGEENPPHQWVPVLLEKTLDDRAIEPAIDLLKKSSQLDDATQTRANAALNILVRYQDRPEVLDAIREASRGHGHVATEARGIIELHARESQ